MNASLSDLTLPPSFEKAGNEAKFQMPGYNWIFVELKKKKRLMSPCDTCISYFIFLMILKFISLQSG